MSYDIMKSAGDRRAREWLQQEIPGASSASQSPDTSGLHSVEPPQSKAPQLQFVRTPCDCGAEGGWRNVAHYDVVRCSCGKYFFILQPKRNGPFVAKLYPGIPGLHA